jgi:hypothetical protein
VYEYKGRAGGCMLARVRGSGTIEGSTGTGIVERANAVKIDPACQ